MRTTLHSPDSLYRRAKIVAVERGMTMRTLFTHALAQELNVPVPFIPSPKPEAKYSTLVTQAPKVEPPDKKPPPKTPKRKPPVIEEEDTPPWLL